MFFRQIIDPLLSQYSYLIGCSSSKEAILFEPERDIVRYFKLAEKNGITIVGAAETHIHADYLSGLRQFAERGIDVYASDEGTSEWQYEWLKGSSYKHRLLKDGDSFAVGNVTIKVVHTPGHTPEHISFIVSEKVNGNDEMQGILSGDFVFVGDVGRPDLLETAAGIEGTMRSEAETLFESIQEFKKLPQELMLWPTHGAGSACGKTLGASPMSTIEQELQYNPSILAAEEKQTFVDYILSGQPEPPFYFARMKKENKEGPKVLTEMPSPKKVSVDDILSQSEKKDAVVIDGREWNEFRRGHIKNTLHAPLNANFILVAGSYIDPKSEISLIVDEDIIKHAVTALVRVGLDKITGFVTPDEIVKSGLATETIDEISIKELKNIIDTDTPYILDVRKSSELEETGQIDSAVCVPYTSLQSKLDEIDSSKTVYVYCRTGNRSAYASSFLKNMGYKVSHVEGGIVAWQGAGYKVNPYYQTQSNS